MVLTISLIINHYEMHLFTQSILLMSYYHNQHHSMQFKNTYFICRVLNENGATKNEEKSINNYFMAFSNNIKALITHGA